MIVLSLRNTLCAAFSFVFFPLCCCFSFSFLLFAFWVAVCCCLICTHTNCVRIYCVRCVNICVIDNFYEKKYLYAFIYTHLYLKRWLPSVSMTNRCAHWTFSKWDEPQKEREEKSNLLFYSASPCIYWKLTQILWGECVRHVYSESHG